MISLLRNAKDLTEILDSIENTLEAYDLDLGTDLEKWRKSISRFQYGIQHMPLAEDAKLFRTHLSQRAYLPGKVKMSDWNYSSIDLSFFLLNPLP